MAFSGTEGGGVLVVVLADDYCPIQQVHTVKSLLYCHSVGGDAR